MVEEYDRSGVQRYNPKPEYTNTPPFMRNSVSNTFLEKNPKYADLFHRCPSCGKNSFVNRDRYARMINGRKCRECNYYMEEE